MIARVPGAYIYHTTVTPSTFDKSHQFSPFHFQIQPSQSFHIAKPTLTIITQYITTRYSIIIAITAAAVESTSPQQRHIIS